MQIQSKADFRALREMVGLSQRGLADMAGVAVDSVKKWEHEKYYDPPEELCRMLETLFARQQHMVNFSLENMREIDQAATAEEKPREVSVTYFRSQAQYDAAGRDPGNFGVVNANVRAVARVLLAAGYNVRFRYPDDPANVYELGLDQAAMK